MSMQHVTGRDEPTLLRSPDGGASAATADAFLAAPPRAGVSIRSVEAGTALVFGFLGTVAMWDSGRIGAGWGADGPQSGYFPFWIGALLVLVSLANLVAAFRPARGEDAPTLFLSWEQARTVATVFIPTVVYVALIPFVGIYLASAGLVAWFMARLGGFVLWRALGAGALTALVTFVVFEFWFLVALPKGPIETWLGF